MKCIVAVDRKWGIGKKNGLLFKLPKDMAYFRKNTIDKTVVMGSNTLKSFPGGKPLKNRTNIVFWPDGEKRDDCTVCGSFDELKSELVKYDGDDIFIIGGAMFYRTMLPYCDAALVTKVDADGDAEVFFENLDELEGWRLEKESEPVSDGEYDIKFTEYKNTNPKKLF